MTSSAAADVAVTDRFRAARDLLLDLREDPDRAHAEFTLPDVGDRFNWAVDWFDADRPRQRPAGAGDRRGGRQPPGSGARSTRWPAAPTRSRPGSPRHGVAQGRRGDRHARQPGRAVGDDARDHEARRGDHADDDRRRAGRPRDRIDRGGARFVISNPADAAKFDDVPGRLRAASRRPARPAPGRLGDARRRIRRSTCRRPSTRAPRPGPAAALLHLRHHVQAQARRAHPGLLPRRPPRRRCTGSACGPATCT